MEGEFRGGATRKRIALVIDDEGALLDVIHELVGLGFHVLLAAGLPEVRRLLAGADDPIDLLLTDESLATGEGPRVAREVRSRYPQLKVLYIAPCGPVPAPPAGPRSYDVDGVRRMVMELFTTTLPGESFPHVSRLD